MFTVSIHHTGPTHLGLFTNKSRAFLRLKQGEESGLDEDIHWYLEKYATDSPFEKSLADLVHNRLRTWSKDLAELLLSSGLFPKRSSCLLLEIFQSKKGKNEKDLYWEVLADRDIWAQLGMRYDDILVVRKTTLIAQGLQLKVKRWAPSRIVNILLVSARPDGPADARYRLISKSLMQTLSWTQTDNDQGKNVRVDFLRPSTWESLKVFLHERSSKKHVYDIVHFDMHGEAEDTG